MEYSDFLSGGDLNRAVDNNLGTKLILPHDKFYILWKGDSGFVANSYYLTSADDSPQSVHDLGSFSGLLTDDIRE